PDIKYNVTEEKIKELAALQKKILENAVKYVKTNGILIYSTCTLTALENTDNYDYLLKVLGLKKIPVKAHLPKGIVPDRPDDGYIVIRPGKYDSDGFFISCCSK
ncbi:MAG: 16S rRNA (cytosine(967)-C(5))-methyltransferase, partial [Lachnospiraceae bacterium]|nr:16S rRNA (cytosine(967)-C(5))-methyltransferase [Lachnospiraceae bacterium]